MGVDYITFGGVQLRTDDVKNQEVKTITHRDGKEERVYVVNFKNGVNVAYRGAEKTPAGFPAYISSSNIGGAGFQNTNVYAVLGLELQGSKKYADNISIVGGSLIGVDVSNDDKSDDVRIRQVAVEPQMQGVLGDGSLYEGQVRVSEDDKTEIQQVNEYKITENGSPFSKNGLGVHRVTWK